jgi:type I restriction enzyme S subunit
LDLDKKKWAKTSLGELAEDISDREDNPAQSRYERFVGLEHFISGDLKIKQWASTENLVSATKVFKAGDVLFARRNAYLRRASMVDFDGVCSGDAFVLRENHKKIVPGFLAFILNSDKLWDYANANAAGTMSKRVKWRDLANYEFLLPPKDQQARIAELLWAADDVVQKYERVIENCELIYECLLKDLRRHESDSGVLLGDLITLEYGQPLKETDRIKGEFPVVGSSGITDSHHEYILEGPGIVIGRKGSAGVVTWVNDNFWPIDTAFWVKIENNAYDLKFLYYLLTSLELPKLAITTAVPGINREDVHYQKVKTFTRDQQKKIITKFTNLENVMSASNKQLQNSKLIQKQLINQVFG